MIEMNKLINYKFLFIMYIEEISTQHCYKTNSNSAQIVINTW